MANVQSSMFYKRAGVRQLTQLTQPPVRPIEEFVFPKSSIYHHVNLSAQSTDSLTFENSLFAGEKGGSIYVHPVTELTDKVNEAKKQPIPVLKDIYAFKSTNKQTRLIMAGSENSVGNPNFPLVIDYTYVEKQYRYVNNRFTDYHRWYNRFATVIENIKTCRSFYMLRDNYIVFDIPDEIPAINTLQNYSDKNDNVIVTHFQNEPSYFIKELFLWIKSNKTQSLLSELSEVDLGFVNIVFTYKSKAFTVMNLGFLSGLLQGQQNSLYDDNAVLQTNMATAHLGSMGINNNRQVEPVWLGRYFLSFLVRVQHSSFFDEGDEELEEKKELVGLKQVDSSEDTIDEEVNEDLVEADLVSIAKHNNVTEEEINYTTFASDDKSDSLINVVTSDTSIESDLTDIIEEKAEVGYLSAVEYKQAKKLLQNSISLKDPDGIKDTLLEAATVAKEDLLLPDEVTSLADNDRVIDKRILKARTNTFHKQYIAKALEPNIKACVANLQRAGIFIQDYTIERQEDAVNDFKVHTVKLKPIDGNTSTIRFKMPNVNEEGTFLASGNKYRSRLQKADLPIRKIASNIVTLSSYYGKLFVSRAEYVANSESVWIKNQLLKKMGSDPNNISVVDSPSFDLETVLPKVYTNFSQQISTYTTPKFSLTFDYKARFLGLQEEVISRYQALEKKENVILIGSTSEGLPLFLDAVGKVFTEQNDRLVQISDHILTYLELNVTKLPNEFVEVKIGGKQVPLVIVLGKLLGLENTVRLFKGKVKIVNKQKRLKATANTKIIEFKDVYMLYDSNDIELQLVLSALIKHQPFVKRYNLSDFGLADVYFSFLEHLGLTARQYREIELLNQLFVDPITKLVLEEMKEPTTFIGLLKRSVELLKDDNYPKTNDGKYMRVRGYERFPGIMYKELVKSVRAFKGRTSSRRLQIELNPYAVSTAIQMDTTVSLVAEINPIEDLKLTEVTTLTGEGGRAKDAISMPARTYHPNDIGTISEATVDSGDVGVTAYLSANPKLKSVLGLTEQYTDTEELDPTEVFSTSVALSAFAEGDDPKRINFINIQSSHTVACSGYHQPLVGTGYETVLANRVSSLFAYTAKKPGVITKVADSGVTVTYDDGEIVFVNKGRRYGRAEGSYYLQNIYCDLKEGERVNKGDGITYNTGFFERDPLNKKNVVWKSGVLARVAFMDTIQTFEDSSLITKSLADKLEAPTIKVHSFVIGFDQDVSKIKEVGERVEPEDVLFYIRDNLLSNTGLFNETTLESLKKLSGKAPKAKYRGMIERIEVYYNGNKDDMSDSLRKIADRSDKQLALERQSLGQTVVTGQVGMDYRIAGKPLLGDNLEIKIFITVSNSHGVGDKLVLANQMKSVVGDVVMEDIKTEDGTDVDMIFSFRSIANRIVTSPIKLGLVSELLEHYRKKVVTNFFS